MNQNNSAIVSVCVVTYNHKNYISQCLDGVLMQQTNFPFEIILGEDESSDGTRELCIEYANRHADKIKLFLRSRKEVIYINGNPTGRFNFIECAKAAKGKYIAMCEGDDYWTDPNKLQKQVDFLEANPEYALCFSGYEILNEFNNTRTIQIPTAQVIDIQTMIAGNSCSTATAVFRSDYFNPIPCWFKEMVFGDWSLYLAIMHASRKAAYCLNDVTATYRIHSGGVHGSAHASNEKLVKAYKQHIDFYRAIQKNLFKTDYSVLIDKCIVDRKKIIANLLRKDRRIVAAALSKFY